MKLPKLQPQIPIKFNKIILVGEAGGEQEGRVGKPFQGRSGKFLNAMLLECGIKRSECLVTNVFNVSPPNNDATIFFINGKMKQGVKAEYCHHIVNMFNLIREYHGVIIPLGNIPLFHLTGAQSPLKPHIGKIKVGGCGIILPMYHPAYLMRPNNIHLLDHAKRILKYAKRTTHYL